MVTELRRGGATMMRSCGGDTTRGDEGEGQWLCATVHAAVATTMVCGNELNRLIRLKVIVRIGLRG